MPTTTRRYTKTPGVPTCVRVYQPDRDRVYLAAKAEGISQSEFLRRALRERATRILAGRG